MVKCHFKFFPFLCERYSYQVWIFKARSSFFVASFPKCTQKNSNGEIKVTFLSSKTRVASIIVWRTWWKAEASCAYLYYYPVELMECHLAFLCKPVVFWFLAHQKVIYSYQYIVWYSLLIYNCHIYLLVNYAIFVFFIYKVFYK